MATQKEAAQAILDAINLLAEGVSPTEATVSIEAKSSAIKDLVESWNMIRVRGGSGRAQVL